ncbi:MAG: cytochrome C biogenesis protein [Methylotenera sp.]|nr:MAG: cytochrome C biogenesis protein [Methylotenera sp.]
MVSISTIALSFIAGVLSLLSPCVLPIIPILLASAISTHRFGPFALAAGLTLSFTVIGVALASFGTVLGIEPDIFRKIMAGLLVVFGIILLFPLLQSKFANATSGVSGSGQNLLNRFSTDSLFGQFIIGIFLGVIWSPCVGPTLGAAMALASQGEGFLNLATVMFSFGLGAGIPLILLGKLSQQSLQKIRNKLFKAGDIGKKIFGVLLLISGLLILTGTDKLMEARILDAAPEWWVKLSTSI